MAKLKKTCHELEKMINDAVIRRGGCSDIERVTVVGPLKRAYTNWDYDVTPKPSTDLLSSETWSTLNAIVGRFKSEYDVQPTELKTDLELVEMITRKLNISGMTVSVQSDQMYGWRAVVITRPEAKNAGVQGAVDSVARTLRLRYDLKT
jgi:hypothetical protein